MSTYLEFEALPQKTPGARKNFLQESSFYNVIHVDAVTPARRVDHLPAAEADAYVGDIAFAVIFGEEE